MKHTAPSIVCQNIFADCKDFLLGDKERTTGTSFSLSDLHLEIITRHSATRAALLNYVRLIISSEFSNG